MANYADANKGSLAAGLEDSTTYGAISTGAGFAAPELAYSRITGESLKYNKTVVQSNEIRPDRNVVDHIEVGADVSGDISAELTFATFDEWFQVLLTPNGAAAADGSDPVAATFGGISITGAIYAWASGTPDKIHRSAGSFITDGFVAGQWVKVTGFTSAENNGIFKLSLVEAADLSVVETTATTEAEGDTVTIKAKMFRNGTGLVLGVAPTAPLPAIVFEKQYTDLTTIFEAYYGCRFNQLTMTLNAQQILTMTWSVLGKTMEQGTATRSSTAVVAANTNTVMNATSNVIVIEEGGTTLTVPVTAITLTFKNNLRQLNQVGSKFPFEQGTGWFQVEGKVTAFFSDQTLRNKMINHTSSSLRLLMTDAAGNSIVITIPKLRFTAGSPTIAGANQNVMVELDFAGYYDQTTDCQAQFDMLAAA